MQKAWAVVQGFISLALVGAVVSVADSSFEAIAFAAGLIAYRRTRFHIASVAHAHMTFSIRADMQLRLLRHSVPNPPAEILEAVQHESFTRMLSEGLRDIDDVLEELERITSIHRFVTWVSGAVDTILILILLMLLLSGLT